MSNTLGIKHTGNCGYRHLVVFAKHDRPPTNQPCRIVPGFVRNSSQNELVGRSKPVSTLWAVSSTKCGAKHPGSQCSAPQPRNPFKGARGGTQTKGSSQSASNASKRGSS